LCAAPDHGARIGLAVLSAQSTGIASLTLSPATIAGGSGSSSTGTITLTAPAPAGGAVIALASSNIELAATMPTVTVPQGATTAAFTVATNPGYRAYSNLSFNATISATLGVARNAVLFVTAQPRPPEFASGSTAGANTQWDGLMCGGIAPIGGHSGILYACSPAGATGFGTCTFQQECSAGCRRVPPSGGTFNDFCATTGPNPVEISDNYFLSGDHVQATIRTEAPVVRPTTGVPNVISIDGNARSFSPVDVGGLHFPVGSGVTTMNFDVATSYVPQIEFINVGGFWFDDDIPPFLITSGRGGHRWAVMLPPVPPPSDPIPTPVQFKIVGLNPTTGNQGSLGQVHTSGLPHGIGPTITFTSSHPSIVPAPAPVTPPAGNLFGFDVRIDTVAPPTDTNVTITATDGRYTFSDVLTVRAAPPPAVLASVSVSPGSVAGGTTAIGTVRLSAPQTTAKVVQISIIDGAPASLPTNTPPCPPSSRCHNVTVPAGATSATFSISTSQVTSQFNLNVFADLAGSPSQSALLLITPGGPTGVKTLTISQADLVGGGAPSTAVITLTGQAPSGGAVVALAKSFADGSTGTVPVTLPASVTVPAGQTSVSFAIATSAVTAVKTVLVTAAFNGSSTGAHMSLFPLLGQVLFSGNVPGGTAGTGTVILNGPAPSGGVAVSLTSGNTSLATVPASVTVPAGQNSVNFTANTQPVSQITSVPITASARGTTVAASLFIVIARTITSVTFTPATVVGPASVTGRVTFTSASPDDSSLVTLMSSNSVLATVPFSIIVPQGQTSATFPVNVAQVTATASVQITATFENVARSGTLTITPSGTPPPPPPPPPPSTPAAPSLVAPATQATNVPQPALLDWNDVSGATSYEVQVDNSSTMAAPFIANPTVAVSQATLAAGLPAQPLWWRVRARNAAGVFGPFSSTRSFTPQAAASGPTATLTVTATGRSGQRVTSTPTGINVSVGTTGLAPFATGTSITLRVTNSRDAIWSGACSSSGSKRKTCTFTLNGNASVTANVQ
jgi:hypothetical protein